MFFKNYLLKEKLKHNSYFIWKNQNILDSEYEKISRNPEFTEIILKEASTLSSSLKSKLF